MSPRSSRFPLAAVALTVALAAPFSADGQSVAQLSVSPGTTRCEQLVTLTVTLAAAAEPAGVVVPLTSSLPAIARLPATLSIVGGTTTGVVQFRCLPVAQSAAVTLSAGSSTATRSTVLSVLPLLSNATSLAISDGTSNTLIVGEAPPAAPPAAPAATPPTIALLTATPATSSCEQPIEFTVGLTGVAPAGGVVVALASSNPTSIQLPPTVAVLPGQTSEIVRVRCSPVQQPSAVTLRASVAGSSKTILVRLLPPVSTSPKDGSSGNVIVGLTTTPGTPAPAAAPTLTSLSLTPLEVPGGIGVTARLTATTGTASVTVSLIPDRGAQAVTLPTAVVLAPGEATKSIVIDTRPQREPVVVEIAASDSRTPNLRMSAKFVIRPPRVRSMALISSSIASGASVNGRLLLDGPAPDGFAVRLTSSSATVPPAMIAVPARATVVSFTLPTKPSSTGATVTLTATALGDTTTGGVATTVKIAP